MARFRRMQVLEEIVRSGLVPIFYHGDIDVAMGVAGACVEAGSRLLEFTHRGDRAHHVFQELCQRCETRFPDLILGAGSIGDPETAAIYLAAGASFIVSPNLNPAVTRLANRRKVAHIPGCGSATEIATAEELGCEIVKLFPAQSLGKTQFVKAILGPCPWTSIMPAGGVDFSEESVSEWFQAGAVCVGIGSRLISEDSLARQDNTEITRRVEQVLAWIKSARSA